MRLFRLTALLATSCLLSACATAPRAKTIGGGAIAVAGGVLAAHRVENNCGQGDVAADACNVVVAAPDAIVDAFSVLAGIGLMALGTGLVISGLNDFQVERDAEHDAELRVEAMPPPAPPLPTQPTALTTTEVPARTDRIEDRLAVQAVLIAREGNCTSAIVTANELAKRDPAMFANLRAADADLAACYAENPLSP